MILKTIYFQFCFLVKIDLRIFTAGKYLSTYKNIKTTISSISLMRKMFLMTLYLSQEISLRVPLSWKHKLSKSEKLFLNFKYFEAKVE